VWQFPLADRLVVASVEARKKEPSVAALAVAQTVRLSLALP
jgi:hypothetical protein